MRWLIGKGGDEDDSEHVRARREEALWIEGITGLTGRDLAGWMTLIDEQGFTDKNEVIDWLRGHHNFPFAWASRLERIHAHGGPLYAGRAPLPPRTQPAPAPARRHATDSTAAAFATPSTPWPLYRPPERHAERLIEWLEEENYRTGEVLAREVQAAYGAMCEAIGWQPTAWNRVSPRFRELVGDVKHYKNFFVDGRRRRWCVISLPARRHATDSPAVAADRVAVAA